jgi:hypothetical protein
MFLTKATHHKNLFSCVLPPDVYYLIVKVIYRPTSMLVVSTNKFTKKPAIDSCNKSIC